MNSTLYTPFGAVYNVEFTPSNDYTVVACHANKAIAVYDARIQSKPLSSVPNAHDDGVNVVSFFDNFLFATGSDDGLIKIWDIRMLSSKSIAILRGHKGWVKNVEIDRRSNQIFSVAFDDGVRRWDIDRLDSYDEDAEDNLIFELHSAVRLRISPDSSTMAISLRKDHMVVVYEFDGNTIEEIKDVVPETFPISMGARYGLFQSFQNQDRIHRNVPTVHNFRHIPDDSYSTFLSVAFHPDSKLVALRLVNIHDYMLQREDCLLYNIALTKPRDSYITNRQMKERHLRTAYEDSPDSVLDYIKEISFSKPDGRVLASPYGNCVRLLGIDENCTPMDIYCDPRYPINIEKHELLETIDVCSDHGDGGVLTCRLNFNSMCLVSGCMNGRLVFNQPRF